MGILLLVEAARVDALLPAERDYKTAIAILPQGMSRERFEWLKEVIETSDLAGRIAYRENEDKDFDARDLVGSALRTLRDATPEAARRTFHVSLAYLFSLFLAMNAELLLRP